MEPKLCILKCNKSYINSLTHHTGKQSKPYEQSRYSLSPSIIYREDKIDMKNAQDWTKYKTPGNTKANCVAMR